ncbi:uncharacterized protein DUF2336 [Breoghania corrubedonensis]|uniref:Uncharacterized protein DUF2336 n=1 Tax=Breoghania corrubedonensis TaxID=665038 RepID=A0A2T5V1M9_9HYPH|nr:DUF2336 domain-containing protein [Breoghania corrubedonensis]PTW57669.1 uncharacterized protein DUF2336 [Breoghania corrubedonensis]
MTGYTTPKGVGSLVQADVRTRKTQLLLAATELFVATEAPTKIERHVYAELFRQYVDGTPVHERRQVATLLARCPFVPHDCALRLAQDKDASVAHRVLAYSTVLGDCDLIAAIGRGPHAVRRAISLRHDISPEVRAALRRHAGDGDGLALLDEDVPAGVADASGQPDVRAPSHAEDENAPVDETPGDAGEPAVIAAAGEAIEPEADLKETAVPRLAAPASAFPAHIESVDAVLQALKDMARPTRKAPRDDVASTPNVIHAATLEREGAETACAVTPDRDAGEVVADVVKATDATEDPGSEPSPEHQPKAEQQPDPAEPPLRVEFGLRRTPPPARPGSLAAIPRMLETRREIAAASPVEPDMPSKPRQVVFRAPPRPEPVAARGERSVEAGATLAPRAERSAPTPGFSASTGRMIRGSSVENGVETPGEGTGRAEVPPLPAALVAFLRADTGERMEAIATAQARLMAEAVSSRVRMRAKIDAELVCCLENAAAARDMETLRRLMARTLELPVSAIERMIADPFGEPLLIAAAAIGLPTSRTVSLLLQVSPAAFSLDRVRELSFLRAHIDIRVARHMVAQWTGLSHKPAVRANRHAPVLDDVMRSRRETIVRSAKAARENTLDDEGVLVLRNAV